MLLLDAHALLDLVLDRAGNRERVGDLPLLRDSQVLPSEDLLNPAVDAPGEIRRAHQRPGLVAVPELGGLLDGTLSVLVVAVSSDSHTHTRTHEGLKQA